MHRESKQKPENYIIYVWLKKQSRKNKHGGIFQYVHMDTADLKMITE